MGTPQTLPPVAPTTARLMERLAEFYEVVGDCAREPAAALPVPGAAVAPPGAAIPPPGASAARQRSRSRSRSPRHGDASGAAASGAIAAGITAGSAIAAGGPPHAI